MKSVKIPSYFDSSRPVNVEGTDFLRQIAALVPGVIYVFNHQTMSNEYTNCSIAELLGYSPEEIKEMGEDLLPAIVHPDDFDLLAEHVGSLQDLEENEKAVIEYRAVRRDGGEVWLRAIETVFTRSVAGKVLRHIGIAFDITVEKSATLRLRDLDAELEQRIKKRTANLERLNAELEEHAEVRMQELAVANKVLERFKRVEVYGPEG